MKHFYLSLLLAFATCLGIQAQTYPGDSWMQYIPDDAPIATLSIPGAHDALTGEGFSNGSLGEDWAQTQTGSFENLWDAGVRLFDIRPAYDADGIELTHGIYTLNKNFAYMLSELKSFLQEHPTECAIFHVLPNIKSLLESNKKTEIANLCTKMQEEITASGIELVDFRADLTMGDMRGKVLLLFRYEGYTEDRPVGGLFYNWCENMESAGDNNENLWNRNNNNWDLQLWGKGEATYRSAMYMVQDIAGNIGDEELAQKKNLSVRQFDFMRNLPILDKKNAVWSFAFLTGYGSTASSSSYRDIATQLNTWFVNEYLPSAKIGPLGFVITDYSTLSDTYGNQAVQAIYHQNFKYLPSETNKAAAGNPYSWYIDSNRHFTQMSMGVKAGVTLAADLNNDGYHDFMKGGEDWALGQNGSEQWSWGDAAYMSYSQGFSKLNESWYNARSYYTKTFPSYYNGAGSLMFDYDQDGDLDMLLIDNGKHGWNFGYSNYPHVCDGYMHIRLIRNDGLCNFVDVTNVCGFNGFKITGNDAGFINSGMHEGCLDVADVNLDGYPDIVITAENNTPSWHRLLEVYINNKGNGFYATESKDFDNGGVNGGFARFGDFNGDGYPDVFATGYSQGSSSDGINGGDRFDIYVNLKNETFERVASVTVNGTTYTDKNFLSYRYGKSGDDVAFQVIDYDQDGKLDIMIYGGIPGQSSSYGQLTANNGSRISYILKNVSDGENVAFNEVGINMQPMAAAPTRMNFLADFNGDGFVDLNARGHYSDWAQFISYSTGKDAYTTVNTSFGVQEGWMTIGDINHDGQIDVIYPDKDSQASPIAILNTSVPGGKYNMQVPAAPTNVKAAMNASGRVTLTWDAMKTSTGSKAMYNVYYVKDGKTFMRCPANKETGNQLTYTRFGNYLADEEFFLDGLTPGVYEIGIQSVTYSWQASEFTKIHLTILDENTPVDVPASSNANVIVNRTLKAGKWNTVCLPFSMDYTQMRSAGFTNVKAFDTYTRPDDYTYDLTLNVVREMEAGKPYLVKPNQAITQFVVNGTNLVTDPVDVQAGDLTFKGTFETTSIHGENYFFISDNTFYRAKNKAVKVKGYRAYFDLAGASNSNVTNLDFDDDGTTGIDNVGAAEEKLVDVYTLSGIQMKSAVPASQALDGLQNGMYIVDGKKVVK